MSELGQTICAHEFDRLLVCRLHDGLDDARSGSRCWRGRAGIGPYEVRIEDVLRDLQGRRSSPGADEAMLATVKILKGSARLPWVGLLLAATIYSWHVSRKPSPHTRIRSVKYLRGSRDAKKTIIVDDVDADPRSWMQPRERSEIAAIPIRNGSVLSARFDVDSARRRVWSRDREILEATAALLARNATDAAIDHSGDGIGHEAHLQSSSFRNCRVEVRGKNHRRRVSAPEYGTTLPEPLLARSKNKARLKGPITTPIGEDHQRHVGMRRRCALRQSRPCDCPRFTTFKDVDLVIVARTRRPVAGRA